MCPPPPPAIHLLRLLAAAPVAGILAVGPGPFPATGAIRSVSRITQAGDGKLLDERGQKTVHPGDGYVKEAK
jgi:hypothetical protein